MSTDGPMGTAICATCSAPISNGSQFCSACGRPAAAPGDVMGPATVERLAKMLTEANLFRMRGQWLDAEARCIDVMRVDPENADAHSLLGDIYRDQSRVDEAAQWYQMAIDIAPDRTLDWNKLAEIDRARAERRTAAPAPPPPADQGPRIGTQKLMGLPPVLWVRVLTAITVVFTVLVVLLVVAMQRGQKPTNAPSGTIRFDTTGTGSSGAAAAPKPLGPPPTIGTRAPAPGGDNGYATPAPSAPPLLPPIPAAPRVTAFQATLARRTLLSAASTIASATVDTRAQRASIVLAFRWNPTGNAEAARETALRDALSAAQTAFAIDQGVRTVGIGVRSAGEDGRSEPFFDAEVDRNAASMTAPGAGYEDLMKAFTNPAWAGETPPASTGQAPTP